MSSKNMLLISKATEQALKIRQSLSQIPGFKLTFEVNGENAKPLLTKGIVDCVIFNFEVFGIVQVALIRSICGATKIPQVFIFADSADEGIMDILVEEKNLIFIEKPLLNFDKDIAGLCVRLIRDSDSKSHREAVRHATLQMVSITLESGKHYDGKIINMNNKGACLEINTSVLKVKDKIKISIILERLNRQRVLMAEVRWCKPLPGRSLIGVRFFNLEDADAQ